MRGGLISTGVILLVISLVLYLIPAPTVGATSGVVTNGQVTTNRAFATLDIPPALTWVCFIAGLLLLILGLALPAAVRDIIVEREPIIDRTTTVERIRER